MFYEECNVENHRILYIPTGETLKHSSLEKSILISKDCVLSSFYVTLSKCSMNSLTLITLPHPKVCLFVYTSGGASMCTQGQVLDEARRGSQSSWSWSYRLLWTTWFRCWGLNSWFQEWQAFQTISLAPWNSFLWHNQESGLTWMEVPREKENSNSWWTLPFPSLHYWHFYFTWQLVAIW